MTRKDERIVTVGMTGASGTQYGLRLVECLIKADYTVYLMFTKAAQIVVGPGFTGDPNDRNPETASAFEAVNRREEFLLGEISGGTKHDEEV